MPDIGIESMKSIHLIYYICVSLKNQLFYAFQGQAALQLLYCSVGIILHGSGQSVFSALEISTLLVWLDFTMEICVRHMRCDRLEQLNSYSAWLTLDRKILGSSHSHTEVPLSEWASHTVRWCHHSSIGVRRKKSSWMANCNRFHLDYPDHMNTWEQHN